MARLVSQRIEDILRAISNCEDYVQLISSEPRLTRMGEDAIERNLQIIGDAVKTLPGTLTEAYQEIPWPQIRGLRNILVHEYFGVDIELVFEVVGIYLPPLKHCLESLEVLEQDGDVVEFRFNV